MGNQSDLDEAQDRLKSGTRLTRWGGWVGRQSPLCRTKWSEWDNACQCFLLSILICISLINPQGWYLQFRWNVVPRFQHKKFLGSHLEYPICNCAHSNSLSPCQPLFWNVSIPGSTKQRIAKELHVTSRCAHRDSLPTLVPEYKVSLPTFGREKRACSH